jgi:surface protein
MSLYLLILHLTSPNSSWDISNVTNMSLHMFIHLCFLTKIFHSWNVVMCDDMSNMFKCATVFNQNIGSLEYRVLNMSDMFSYTL